MTALDAYNRDDVFRALIHEWVENRRCPAPLVDRCMDLDMEGPADCARWASDPVVTPDRHVYMAFVRGGEKSTPCGPYPTLNNEADPTREDYGWFWSQHHYMHMAHGVSNPGVPDDTVYHLTPTVAILWLLDIWVVEPI